MTFGAEIWGPPLIAAGASWLTGKGSASKESKMQKTQRKLIDKLIGSLNGQGEFSDLFDSSPEAFQKSFVEPAQARFRNQTAPMIQQQYIESGQQRGTGLDDTLTRAGVDLDSMLNQYAYQFGQDSLNRKQNSINSILGAGAGAPNQTTGMQDILGGTGGYLSSNDFSSQFKDYFKKPVNTTADSVVPPRKGFES